MIAAGWIRCICWLVLLPLSHAELDPFRSHRADGFYCTLVSAWLLAFTFVGKLQAEPLNLPLWEGAPPGLAATAEPETMDAAGTVGHVSTRPGSSPATEGKGVGRGTDHLSRRFLWPGWAVHLGYGDD